jgi:hypothetical protein
MSKIICEDWELYDYEPVDITSTQAYTGEQFKDIKMEAKCIRVYGTEDQVKEASKHYNIDEAHEYKVEPEGSYWHFIYGKKAQSINEKVEKKLKEYQELYKKNNNKLLKIRTR